MGLNMELHTIPREMLRFEDEAGGFHHISRALVNFNALKNNFWSIGFAKNLT